MRRSEKLVLCAILLTAAFLRTQYFLQIEHNIDHAYPVWQALQTLEHGDWRLTGQSTSVLFANPALTGYLYLPFVALTRSPLSIYILIIALNTVAVLLAFRAVRTLLGTRPALVAGALMAVNPWVIEYSRSAWVQSLLPFFACTIAWLLWPVLLRRSRNPLRRTILALVMLTLMTQTYLLAFMMTILVGVLLLIFRRRVPARAVMIGGAIFLAASLVYGVALWTQRDSVQRRLDDFSSHPAQLSSEAWNHALRLVSGSDYALARGQLAPAGDWQLRQDLSQIGHYGILVALVLGIGRAIFVIWSSRRAGRSSAEQVGQVSDLPLQQSDAAIILLIWFGLPVLLMSYVGQPVHLFYQLLGLPAGYALAAWGLTSIFRPNTRIGVAILLALGLPFGALMGVNSARYYQETAATPGIDGTGALPLEWGLRLGRAITDHLSPGSIVYADEAQWTFNSFAGTTFPVIRDARAPIFSIVPREGGLYIAPHTPGSDAMNPPTSATRAETLTLPDGWTITIDEYMPNAADLLEISHLLERWSEQGITLIGYDLEKMETTYTLTSYWRIESVSAETPNWLFAPFAHIFDESGARVLIVDGALVPGSEWHTGDIHVHRITIDLPTSGAFSASIGQYDSVSGRNVIFLPDYVPTVSLPLE
jgi:4-amino-4-deoxy-L-arabinose transferase-like glycosyltransferase